MKTKLNLAAHRFPAYRRVNLALAAVLVGALAAGAWLAREYFLNPPDVGTLEADELKLREQWDALGDQVAGAEGRLQGADAESQMSELVFLSQIMARKQFSWTRLLREIERVIPNSVQLVGLVPEISEGGNVSIQMEARGRSVLDLSAFIEDLERTDAFRNVKAFEYEEGLFDGRRETRVVMGADYVEAALGEVTVTGE